MARVLIIETGDEWRALAVPDEWDTDDVDRYLNGQPYGRAAIVAMEEVAEEGGLTTDPCPRCGADLNETLHGDAHAWEGGCPSSSWQDDGEDPDTFLPSRPGEPYGGGV